LLLTQLSNYTMRSHPSIYTKRRTVMVNLALVDALAYGAIFIFIMIGILGMCMEMGLKKMGLKG